jgi:hypothetical protein
VDTSDPGWLARAAPAPVDATPRFLELYERARADPRWFPEALRRDVFLLVQGLFTERYPLYLLQNEQRMRARWPLELTRRYLQRRYGAASDGFVAAVDGAIPGSRLVRLEQMDHAGLALRWFGSSAWDAGAATQALLAMAADQAGDRARSPSAA